VSCFL